jgi:hypothetical protein
MMLLLLVLLLGLLEYVRVAGRRNIRASSLEDEVMQLMGAVGFQVGTVCTASIAYAACIGMKSAVGWYAHCQLVCWRWLCCKGCAGLAGVCAHGGAPQHPREFAGG